jgi:hypothetical protein
MSDVAAVPQPFVDAVRRRAGEIAPGWEVSVKAPDSPDLAAAVLLSHPLSSGLQVLFRREHVDEIDLSFLDVVIRSAADELARVTRAPRWHALTGVCEWWADEGICDVGRARYHQARRPELSSGKVRPLGTVDRRRVAFVARRDPFRLAQVDLAGRDACSLVASADNATAVLDGSPAKARVIGPKVSYGDLGLRRMLHPAALETIVPRPWPSQLHVEGHLMEADMSLWVPPLSLGADFYEVAYDEDLDVLTAWTAYIDGAAACRISVSHLADVGA